MPVMSVADRQRFLADLHVGVLSVVALDDRGTALTVPIWYRYSPADRVSVITSPTSAKGRALAAVGAFTLVAQVESVPYRYVSVDGPIVETRVCELERDLLPMAVRYLGAELGAVYAQQWGAMSAGSDYVYVMRPRRWRSFDQTQAVAANAS